MNNTEREQAYKIIDSILPHLTDEELKSILVKLVTRDIK